MRASSIGRADKPFSGGTVDSKNELRRNIGLKLTVLGRLTRRDFDRHVGDVGMTRSQWSLIAVVARFPGASQRKIADLLEMSEASAGRLIDRLEADGVIERRSHEGDRRARMVFLTPKADPLIERMSAFAKVREARLFRGIGDEQLVQLSDLLDLIYTNLGVVPGNVR
jgi:MarR family transcriptional regulator for hemolysin